MTNKHITAPVPSPEYLRFAAAVSNAISANRELLAEFNEGEQCYEYLEAHSDYLDDLFGSFADVKELIHVSKYVDDFRREMDF